MLNANYRGPIHFEQDPLSHTESTFPGSTSTHGGRPLPRLELWGGVECTVNRVGDSYFDQIERSGHASRLSDLDLLADLGIRTLRYPVLWERTAPQGVKTANWHWADERMSHLRNLGVRPIVGLVHHGSGPRDTSLVDPAFPEKLAEYAQSVAERYPWVDAYTPVNEILTTARFSGLYGHWYPHGRDGLTFARALVGECRGTILAMRAIREINPRAQLIQTDDLGKTYSTPALSYQADFDNERRWLGWDLLCGRVDREHLMWDRLVLDGIPVAELEWFLENPCPPDVLGINHYPNSERMLDERLERYPEWSHGGNAMQRYADVEAVRVLAEGLSGLRILLREAWDRYGIPIAVTEVHHGCTRDEQMRWVFEVWNAAQELRKEGVDLRAVTPWAMLGLFDWNQLCVRDAGHYEPGVFDIRSGTPRPTALAGMLRTLAKGQTPTHPLLRVPGWWKRPERIHYPAVHAASGVDAGPEVHTRKPTSFGTPNGDGRGQPVLITGGTGTLGQAFARICEIRGIPYRLLRRQDMDISAAFMVEDALDELRPWAVINTAGYVRVDDAEREAERCFRENTEGAAILAEFCARRGVPLVTFSSDLVFDGKLREAYTESAPVSPLNVYGQSKAEAERRVMAVHPGALVLRTSAFFGPWDEYNFVTIALRELAAGRPFLAMDDAVVSPTYVPDLVNTALDLLIDGEYGIWHLANQGQVTWHDFAKYAAELARVDASCLEGRPMASLGLAAKRPRWSVLGSERALLLPTLDDALGRYLQHCDVGAIAARRQVPRGGGRSECPASIEAEEVSMTLATV